MSNRYCITPNSSSITMPVKVTDTHTLGHQANSHHTVAYCCNAADAVTVATALNALEDQRNKAEDDARSR